MIPDAEMVNTRRNTLKDFMTKKTLIVKAQKVLKITAPKATDHMCFEFPWFEHPDYGDDCYSFICDVYQLEYFQFNMDANRDDGGKNNYTVEEGYVDLFLGEHEAAAWKVGDFTNPNLILKSFWDTDEYNVIDKATNPPTRYRCGVHQAILDYYTDHDPENIEDARIEYDKWPSGLHRDEYMRELPGEFLGKQAKRKIEGLGADGRGEVQLAIKELERRGRKEEGEVELCKGIAASTGNSCKNKAVKNGYCKTHSDERGADS